MTRVLSQLFLGCSSSCWPTCSCWPGWVWQLSPPCPSTCTSTCGPSAGTAPLWKGPISAWTCVSSVGASLNNISQCFPWNCLRTTVNHLLLKGWHYQRIHSLLRHWFWLWISGHLRWSGSWSHIMNMGSPILTPLTFPGSVGAAYVHGPMTSYTYHEV